MDSMTAAIKLDQIFPTTRWIPKKRHLLRLFIITIWCDGVRWEEKKPGIYLSTHPPFVIYEIAQCLTEKFVCYTDNKPCYAHEDVS